MGPNNGVSGSSGVNNGSRNSSSNLGKQQTSGNNKKCTPARVKNCLRTFLAHLFSHIGLCVLVVGYAIVGAFLFENIEKKFEEEQREIKQKHWNNTFTEIRKAYVDILWNITEKYNVLYQKNWTRDVEKRLRLFEASVAEAADEQGYRKWINRTSDLHWSFSGALLYSVSIITTIGYGNTAPRTALGKVLTMFYAVIGVPLMLLWLSNIGTLMANTFKFAYNHVCCPRKSARSRSVQKRSPSLKQEPSSIQVKYSVSAMTCETHVVQPPQHHHQQQQFPQPVPPPPHAYATTGGRGGGKPRREHHRTALKALDPAAKQMLRECAEYNVNMSQDERSRMVLQQLQAADAIGTMAGIEEEFILGGDENDPMVDIILPPPLDDMMTMDDSVSSSCCRQSLMMAPSGGSVVSGQSGNGGSVSGHNNEGTPSRVPLLQHHRGGDTGPDVVDVETLDEYSAGSIELMPPPGSTAKEQQQRCESPNPIAESGDRVPISLVLIFVVFYIMLGAMVFSAVEEDWSFLESAYFCFITLSTIGLGDYVPGKSLDTGNTHAQLIGCCLYLVLGLAIIAMSFNLVQEEVAAKVKDMARHIGIIKDSSGDR